VAALFLRPARRSGQGLQADLPVPNVCTTSLVGGQWQDTGAKDLELRIVTNKDAPNIPVNSKLLAI